MKPGLPILLWICLLLALLPLQGTAASAVGGSACAHHAVAVEQAQSDLQPTHQTHVKCKSCGPCCPALALPAPQPGNPAPLARRAEFPALVQSLALAPISHPERPPRLHLT